jgi:hypothetical protein
VGCTEGRGQTRRLEEGARDIQAADTATDQPLGWAQHVRRDRIAAPLCLGMESLFRLGANTENLARAGQVDAAPDEDDPTQAMVTRQDDLPGPVSYTGRPYPD